HRADRAAGAGVHAGRCPEHHCLRTAPGGVARRSPAHRLPSARRRTFPGALVGTTPTGRHQPGHVPPGHHHPLAAGRTGVREVGMADEITLEVARYRPELDSEPGMESFHVPLGEHWAVLDGLTYIKDELDDTLAFRGACRMVAGGSGARTVTGEP